MHLDWAYLTAIGQNFTELHLFSSLSPPSLFTGCIKIVNLQGRLKSSRKLSAELTFNFQIEATGQGGKTDPHSTIQGHEPRDNSVFIFVNVFVFISLQFVSKTAYWPSGGTACRDGVLRPMRWDWCWACVCVFVRLCPFKGKITFNLFVIRLTFRHHGRMSFNLWL